MSTVGTIILNTKNFQKANSSPQEAFTDMMNGYPNDGPLEGGYLLAVATWGV